MDPTIEWGARQGDALGIEVRGRLSAISQIGPDCAGAYNKSVEGVVPMQLQKYEQSVNEDAYFKMRRDLIREDIAKRLRKVCSHLSDAEFKKLVDSMVEQKLKGERRRSL